MTHDRPTSILSVVCRRRKHRVVLMAGGALSLPDHTAEDRRRELAVAALGGQPCECVALLVALRNRTAGFYTGTGTTPCDRDQRLWRRWYRRHRMRPLPEVPDGTDHSRFQVGAVAWRLVHELVKGPLQHHAIEVLKTEYSTHLSVSVGGTRVAAVSPNNRLKARTGVHIDSGHTRDSGTEFDNRFDYARTLDQCVITAERQFLTTTQTARSCAITTAQANARSDRVDGPAASLRALTRGENGGCQFTGVASGGRDVALTLYWSHLPTRTVAAVVAILEPAIRRVDQMLVAIDKRREVIAAHRKAGGHGTDPGDH